MISTYQNQGSSRVSIAFDLIKPEVGDTFKTFLVGDIIDQKDGMRTYVTLTFTFIVGIGDGSEAFLSCRIPDL